ncbi:AAA family ATPase [Dolichospermum sp. ST_con]|nr:AAA family ATPase [Dolichospermum sp. ST_con]MDD1417944.1 AAA family ATPase [Dolichospermum sp. ST_sed1]MDD1423716.1 AAA family ATPase [Dolichospermum sp. ST_sed9]MDD1431038.1 AAA family ATPase [Dolichospermum sp. ST_sed6]MDD1435293.1 AAA family ATPase [Dolichospermum sp. ST_sed10]MDD1439208.1 AAA family ATPase [Dolichospermum sp. ST_sed3]MDD1445473.1 AAA family ATPase [Dolichospermum sp. ST_sed8]MDD1453942.1 AAA family ATPase [Dolichospermum sp. ST_sed7]MDD1459830.1 AAA family ATPase [D
MKLHSLEIKNFRAINDISLDFTDLLSRPRTINLIVGPNGSGKTSILDAIHVVVKVFENPQNPELREGLEYNVQQLVRCRGNIAQIAFEYSIERDEAEAINDVYSSLELKQNFNLSNPVPPLEIPAKVTWSFPNREPNSPYHYSYLPKNSIKVLGARGRASQSVYKNLQTSQIFDRIGGVCYLDQRRTVRLFKSFNQQNQEDKNAHGDVLSWLNEYYRKDLTWNEEKYGESYWKRVQRLFNKICFPSELIGLESGPASDTLILKKKGIEYDLLQMSSGEHQILRILVGLAADTAKNSIVLIDEVELHLHPAWQKRLIQVLRKDESNNQYIFTTHSPTVAKMFYDFEIINLGDLAEK